ncbi:MAG: endonuclease/exonuclease/phosphatase family protein [Acidobacteriota bacterium]|nr:endonuclease/exonuclease/phosphatase family protein [Acidobacteriota bacterium]
MPTNLRIATFNCENLFSRPKIFNEDAARSKELLGFVAELQEALRNDVFDQGRIKSLKSKLRGFITINDVRGKHDKVAGAKEWFGWVELVRSDHTDASIENTARVIVDINADVICLMEVEDRNALQKFHDGLVNKFSNAPEGKPCYEYILLVDGNDQRGIDVAVMSRLPINWLRTHIHERTLYEGASVPLFSRDCLEAQVTLPKKKKLHLLINHLKSQGYFPPTDKNSARRRLGQATRVAELVDEHKLNKEFVIVAGDLNSDPSLPSLAPLVNHAGLFNVNLNLPDGQRGTYKTSKQQLDYLFISTALKSHLQAVQLERRGVYTKTKWTPYPTVTSARTQASDHSAVVADFQF